MTTEQFIERSANYYSDYSPEQRRVVVAWLNHRTERERDVVYAEVLKSLSPKYKTPPGIYELEQAWHKALETRYNELGSPPDPNQKQIAAGEEEEPLTEEEAEYYFDELKKTIGNLAEAKRFE